ncbi:MAG: FKBP-type peptidyl-prolyl cis-trans isomerase [Verrucomicrobiales bacterium]
MQTIPFRLVASFCLAMSTLAVSSNFIMAQDTETPETLKEKVSYAYGLMIARQLSERGIEIDLGQFNAAFEAVVNDEELAMSEEEVSAAFTENQRNMDKAGVSGADKKNLEAGQAFLEENAKKEGVETTASGLQYEVLEKGDGASPGETDTVTVHYHGTLIDGTVFDSSVDRGEPANFPLNRVIPGWTEGVQLMSEGAKYRFFVPYDLAYGERGAGEDIKPYSTLIFDVELLGIGDGE